MLRYCRGLKEKSLENKQLVEDPVDFHGEPLNPRILDPFLPTNWEKNQMPIEKD